MTKIIKAIALAAAVLSATPAHAGMTYYLTGQWMGPQGQMCQYGNGTILNVGFRLCPLSIQG